MSKIIHISGFPGSGKTTLGEKIKKLSGVVVKDTDDFIQHHNKAGRLLLSLEKKSVAVYTKAWKDVLKKAIDDFVAIHRNKVIVFVGSLDNFAPTGIIYNIDANYKFLLDVPLPELLRRYYLRVYIDDQKKNDKQSKDYWDKLSKDIYHINSSENINKEFVSYNAYHFKHGYVLLDDNHIIKQIKSILK